MCAWTKNGTRKLRELAEEQGVPYPRWCADRAYEDTQVRRKRAAQELGWRKTKDKVEEEVAT